MPLIIAATVVIAIAALLTFRWFHRYRFTKEWRRSEFRGVAFGMLMWFGGIFGHRVPPPPQTKVEFASGRPVGEASGRPPLPDHASDDEK
ncbi:MAG TPA: hypothetical protein VIN39_12360 [Candidatus Dormibacteraeota bacterium]|jgi:hypothetical protein